jgi:cellobiose phosphorylase
VPFLEGELLQEGEDERYGLFITGAEVGSLYEHCRRAIAKGSTAGKHGLPLIGSHDWNDGLNRVGHEGRGESVWLGWFLHNVLTRFRHHCVSKENQEDIANYRQKAAAILDAIEANAWDGQWYLRAFYDDGTALGSAKNQECQIDSLAQSWAVLSGVSDPVRAEQAMKSVLEKLVKMDDQMVLLFTPPFDKTKRDPGYIKGYLPGIRENGGQYTHAALWAAWAFAKMGQGDRAVSLFQLLNPIYHANTPEKINRYRVEPYVVAADVYSMHPHVGRGGWTWYTGSASWMYRLGVEAILGLERAGKSLQIHPCIPKDWKEFELTYRVDNTSYHIRVENPDGVNQGVNQVISDGEILTQKGIPILNDGQKHNVNILMGCKQL